MTEIAAICTQTALTDTEGTQVPAMQLPVAKLSTVVREVTKTYNSVLPAAIAARVPEDDDVPRNEVEPVSLDPCEFTHKVSQKFGFDSPAFLGQRPRPVWIKWNRIV